MLYTKSSDLYDVFYGDKDYKQEVEILFEIIKKHKFDDIKSILDVACGTGNLIQYFKNYFQEVEGADLSRNLLEVAKKKFPDTTFNNQDMLTLSTGKKFDVISILFELQRF